MTIPPIETKISIHLLEKLQDGLISLKNDLKSKDESIKKITESRDKLRDALVAEKRISRRKIAILSGALAGMTLATALLAYKYFTLLYKK